MRILMIANFVNLPNEKVNCRFMYLLNMLKRTNNEIELVTSNFKHGTKNKRKYEENELKGLRYKITLIDEPGYKKNISLKRFYSHYKLGKNLGKYLDSMKAKPDVIYCAIPSLDVGKVCAKYCKKHNIRFIIDIQDLWPEAFKMVFNIPIISSILFYPIKKKADYIYSNADNIVAVSETYCNRALKVNKKTNKGLSVFLGTDLKYFDKCEKENKIEFNDNLIRIAYIGTLGHSYDIPLIIDAIKILNNNGIDNIKFIIIGDGPLKENFENYAKDKKINCEFTGRLEYEKMVGLLCSCDIAVNPIKKGSAGSIINKVGDYAAAGLPVVNTQESVEYRNLLDTYEAGINCISGNAEEISQKLESLFVNKKLIENIGINSRKLAEEKFDRNKTYARILSILLGGEE